MTRSFALTLFADVRAQTMRAASMTLDEMAWHARVTRAPSKDRLPLWKLATFGNWRSPSGALRFYSFDANVPTAIQKLNRGEAASKWEKRVTSTPIN